jgi:DNA-binding FrmR family transcriptional regulator
MQNRSVVIGVSAINQKGNFEDLDEALILMDKAVKNAISTVEGKILKNHLQACVKDALTDSNNFDDKVDELLKTLKR